jgi:hypothetical protein
VPPDPLAAREQTRRFVRSFARAIRLSPHDEAAHLARLQACLALDGLEPVQGALADAFVSFGADRAATKRRALALATPRLHEWLLGRFERWVHAPALPRITPLATRWSVIAVPSADMSTRARRCSPDVSRAVAAQALTAWQANDLDGLDHFLHHCLTCRDRLAFMLVRRALYQRQASLPDGWAAVETELLQGDAHP